MNEPPTFYVASSRDRLADVLAIAELLTASGMRNAFVWPEHFTHRCSSWTCGVRGRADLARHELDAARTCDLFIGIARMGKGTHVELGAALTGPFKRVILVGVDCADLVFYEAAGVEHAADVDGLRAMLAPAVEHGCHDPGDEDRRPILLGPWCDRCGDAFDGPERDCPRPAPGRP